MLKKFSIALCVSSLFGAGVAMADPGSSNGQISFTGKVTHEAPTVVVKRGTSGTGDSLSSNPEIQLGEYTASELDKKTEFYVDKSRKFQIVIQRPAGTAYNHITEVDVKLTANIENKIVVNDLERDNVTTSAKNVGVAIQYYGTSGYTDAGSNAFAGKEDGSAAVSFSEPSGGFAYAEVDPTFYFAAALQQLDTSEAIGGGSVKSTVNVEVEYK